MSLSNLSQPVAPRERLLHVDIIRGIAVFGLIWVNLNPGFNPGPLTIADVTARWTMSTFAAGKAFTLFSLLFGVTLAMQLERADRDSRPIALRWLRRMSVLYAIGWAHAILFWPGDILRDYAIAGAVLIAFRRLSSRGLVLAAVVALALASNRDSLSMVITRLVRGNVEAVTPLDITSKLMLAFGYLAALLLLLQRQAWLHRLRWLAPVGRLGLTNYISQTAFLAFVTFNYGLGLAPMWFACLVIAVAFYVVQIAWSNWWVRHFSVGPVEWLWRRLTYGGVSRAQSPLAKAA